jgi:Tfp pilus assembly protein PilO
MRELINKIKLYYNKLNLKNKDMILISALAVIFLTVDYNLVLNNQFKLLANLNTKIKDYKSKSLLAKDFSRKVESFNSRRLSLKSKSEQLAKEIVPEEDVSLLIENISTIANKEFVKISQIRPQIEGKSQKLSTQEFNFSLLNINIEASAGYHQLGKFLNKLEKSNSFISVRELGITQEPSSNLRHSVRLVLATFIKKPVK